MQSFEKLLESVRSVHPDLISEEAANEMLAQYNSGIDQIKSDALAEGQALGWKEGYDEGKAVAQQEAQKSLEDLSNKLDQEATEKLKAVLDMINEEHATKLQQVYDMLMSTRVPVEDVEAMDADHAQKFEEATTALTEAAEKKLSDTVKQMEADNKVKMESAEAFHNKKLKGVKLVLENKLAEAQKELKAEKDKKLSILSEQVEKYLNYALQEAIPAKQIISEQKYQASQKAIEKITSILKINNIIQESKDGIFADYENKIKAEKATSNKLISENAELKLKLNREEAKVLLEEKLQKSVPAEAAFLRTYFKNADSKQIIEEQIEDAKAVFARLHSEKRRELVQNEKKRVNAAPSKVVTESKKETVKKEPVKQVAVEDKAVKSAEKKTFASVYAELLNVNKN